MAPVSLEAAQRTRDAHGAFQRLEAALATVIHGKPDAVRAALSALAARGHLLIEDVPGVGKTTLARALAKSVGGTFRRIQFTSDLLPSDILGVTLFNQEAGRFEFRPGPIFANVVLADEINRTTPRTQSALLEAMSEGRVSLENHTHEIAPPFMVIATQNPIEHFGTYPLPESQMDRFLLRIRLGYPNPEDERRVVSSSTLDPVEALAPQIDGQDVRAIQDAVLRIKVDESLLDYAQRLVTESRGSQFLALGVSPRGFQSWFRASQARAFAFGRDFAVPDDFKEMALPALSHRVVVSGSMGTESLLRARDEAERIIRDMLDRLPVPV